MLNSAKILLAAAFLLAGITAASAQIEPSTELKANVPFSFVVDGKTFPAGDYTFTRTANTSDDSSELVMRGEKGDGVIIETIPSETAKASKETHLVFDKVAGEYFLAQIWGKGTNEGNELVRTKTESKAIAAAAGSSTTGETSGADSN